MSEATPAPFGAAYAAAYDALYGDKDYVGECALIERLLAAHGQSARESPLGAARPGWLPGAALLPPSPVDDVAENLCGCVRERAGVRATAVPRRGWPSPPAPLPNRNSASFPPFVVGRDRSARCAPDCSREPVLVGPASAGQSGLACAAEAAPTTDGSWVGGLTPLLWRRFPDGHTQRILDLGCGTGGHALVLAARGHAVTGVDRSLEMLAFARTKAAALALPSGADAPAFLEGDLRTLDLGQRFDAVLMMFAVLGYQRSNADLRAALASVRRHLEPGALFIFDVWNGAAVLTERPGPRVRVVETPAGPLERHAEARLDTVRHLCRVRFTLRVPGQAETVEEHVMRYFFPLELELALDGAGLQLLDLRRFPDGTAPPDEQAWNVVGVARAI